MLHRPPRTERPDADIVHTHPQRNHPARSNRRVPPHRGRFFWKAPARHLPFQPPGRPPSPFLTGIDFLENPCVPPPVLGIRTPKLPLLPLWEKGVGGMRGKGARECRTSRISRKNSTRERLPLLPCGRRGLGGMRGKSVENAEHRSSLPGTLPLRAARRPTRIRLPARLINRQPPHAAEGRAVDCRRLRRVGDQEQGHGSPK